jgi:hypothetical protein
MLSFMLPHTFVQKRATEGPFRNLVKQVHCARALHRSTVRSLALPLVVTAIRVDWGGRANCQFRGAKHRGCGRKQREIPPMDPEYVRTMEGLVLRLQNFIKELQQELEHEKRRRRELQDEVELWKDRA